MMRTIGSYIILGGSWRVPYRAVQALIIWRNPRRSIIRYDRLGFITPLNALASTIRRRWQATYPERGPARPPVGEQSHRGSGSIVSRVLVATAAGLTQSRKWLSRANFDGMLAEYAC